MKEMLLGEVRIYQNGSVLRANLHFKNRNDKLVLRNYRASDCIALAVYYNIPILVRRKLLRKSNYVTISESLSSIYALFISMAILLPTPNVSP